MAKRRSVWVLEWKFRKGKKWEALTVHNKKRIANSFAKRRDEQYGDNCEYRVVRYDASKE